MSTKFKPGDRVRAYTSSGHIDGEVVNKCSEGFVKVELDSSYNCESYVKYHPKQLRRLVKRKRVVWESEQKVHSGYYEGPPGGAFLSTDGEMFHSKLAEFVGKRVRIVITEAKPHSPASRIS